MRSTIITRWVVPLAIIVTASSAWAGGKGYGKKYSGKARAVSPSEDAPRSKPRPPRGVALPGAVRDASQHDIALGEPVKYHNISLVPVFTTRAGPFDNYTLLEEGIASKSFEVRELEGNSNQAQVNAVQVRNKGKQPVYLLGGEMILGGKQDRIISRDTVIPNDSGWTRVAVFCVEQGRWRGQRMKFTTGGAIADLSIQKAAMKDSQSAVWDAVAKKNLFHGTQSSTQTYRRTIQNAKVRRKVAPYVADISSMIPDDRALAGVVFGINGRIHVADMFGNPVLYDKLSRKLLSAYVLEALSHQVDRNAPPVRAKSAKDFIDKGRAAKKKSKKGSGRTDSYGKETEEMLGTETIDSGTKKKVRETYISK